MLRNSGAKLLYSDKNYTDVSPKRAGMQSHRSAPSPLPFNSGKSLKTEGEDLPGGSSYKRIKLEATNVPLNTKPSRSIPPPNRPGSLQSALLVSEDADVEVVSKVGSISNTDTNYTYTPLQPGQFRLLRLHPGQGDDDEITCSLVTDSVHAPSAYEALSYVWGECTATHLISLSDEDGSATFTLSRPFYIGSNLYDALLDLRLPDRPVILWVDALCIDQSNNEEKCVQVSMMRTIYRNAHRVLVWLGSPDTHSDWFISNMSEMLKPGFFSDHDQDCNTAGSRGLTDPTPITLSSLWTSFVHLCSRPYWARMWVLQEVALAPAITFLCGQRQVDFKDLRVAAELLVQWHIDNNIDLELHMPNVERASTILGLGTDVIRRSASGELINCKETLAELVLRFRNFQATDPRDRIYALLGLASDKISFSLDYNKSTLEVYRDFVGHAITQLHLLDIIIIPWAPVNRRKTISGSRSTEDEQIPSWLASLEDLPYGGPSQEEVRSRRLRRNSETLATIPPTYNASKNMTPNAYFGPLITRRVRLRNGEPYDSTQPNVRVDSAQNTVLWLDGVRLGIITDLSTRMADGLIPRDALELAGLPFMEGSEALRNIPDARFQRLWRTLVADRDSSGKPAPMRFGLAFRHLFRRILQLRSLDTVELLDAEEDTNIRAYLERVRDVTWNRRVFLSEVNEFQENLLGLAPRGACVGDTIAILCGLSVPVLLRPSSVGGGGSMEIVGAAYVDGKMEGEVLHEMGHRMEERMESFQIV